MKEQTLDNAKYNKK
jgi:hypothetical protein